jgi:hypothetical protein
MTQITTTTQLSTFSIIRGILISNSTLATKFSLSDFYEFEPKHKSVSFKGYPYIIINVPETDELDDYLGDLLTNREFEVEIVLRMEYQARSNYTSYASNVVSALDNGNTTFRANGYNLISIKIDSTEVQTLDQKDVVEGRFTLTLDGEVT